MTDFEEAAVIGKRARMLALNANPLVSNLEGQWSALAIAEMELNANLLDFEILRRDGTRVNVKNLKRIPHSCDRAAER